jgi:carbamoyl-phosphate synthase large subunit
MPRRSDLESICLIGSGPIVIGQACEFDYAGCQALKVLREEGFRTIVRNSNPATIMTDPGFADRTYIEPLTRASPPSCAAGDALLPTLGGQTALNLALAGGVLDELSVELIGAPVEVIRRAEDRELFRDAVRSCGLEVPASTVVTSLAQAGAPLPAVVRPRSRSAGTEAASPRQALPRASRRARPLGIADRAGARRGVRARLGRVRARSCATARTS